MKRQLGQSGHDHGVTGAGDMVLAALLAARANGISWHDAVVFANAAAGLEVERFGCVPIPLERIHQSLLATLPREARRLARWYQWNRLIQTQGRGRVSPLRIGYPPGRRKRPTHLVDDILKECQALALDALDPPDTS